MVIDLLFILLGSAFSLFYAFSSYRIFTYPHTDDVYIKNNLKKFDVTKRARLHEFWTHLICSVSGWVCLYILYSNLLKQGLDKVDIRIITVNHFLLLLIGLLGVVGFLPLTLWGVANAVQYLSKEAIGVLGRILGITK